MPTASGPEITNEMLLKGGPGLTVPVVLELLECAYIVRALKEYHKSFQCLIEDGFDFDNWDDPASTDILIRAARTIEKQVQTEIDKRGD